MSRRRIVLGIAAGVVAVVVVATVVHVSGGSSSPATAGSAGGASQADDADTAQERRELAAELDRLADAWALGGGTFGYPFWEKAQQRWQAGRMSSALFREYATGYRDRLRAGCELLDATDVDQSGAKDVRSLLLDACSRRIDALDAQQQWLDARIERDHLVAAPVSGAAAPVDTTVGLAPAELAARRSELADTAAAREAEFRAAIEESYRDARLALDLAQSELDAAQLDRLPEGAFI